MRVRVVRLTASFQAMLLMATLIVPALTSAAVWTDQPAYAPGPVVTISGDDSNGAGYLPGETVHIDVNGPNGWVASCGALVDTSGAWSCQVTLNADPDIAVGDYSYGATGLTSGASETGVFSDGANVTITNAPFAWHRTGEVGGGFNVSVAGKYSCNNSGTNCTSIVGINLTVTGVAGTKTVSGLSTGQTNADWSTTLQFRSSPSGDQFPIPADGKYDVVATLDTNLADQAASRAAYFGVDNTPPTSTITCNNAACTGAYAADVTVRLSSTDPNGSNASGTQSGLFCVDTTNTCTPNLAYPNSSGTSVTRVSGATKYVRYQAMDNAGNSEAVGSRAIVFTTDDPAPFVLSSVPSDTATGVASSSNIVVAFSEPVTVTTSPSWISVICNGTPVTGQTTGNGSAAITFNPDNDFASGASCSVQVQKNQVTDSGSNSMTNNYTFGFTAEVTTSPSVTIVTCPVSVVYSGSPLLPCTYTVTGAGGLNITASPVPANGYSNNTDVGTAAASYTYPGDTTHTSSTDSKNFSITKASTSATLTCPAGPYHNTRSAATPRNYTITGANLSIGPNPVPVGDYSNNTNAGTASASYQYPGDSNHSASNTGSDTFSIGKADAVCTVTPYTSLTTTYNASAHTATGSCTGVDAGNTAVGGSLDLTNTTHTNAGTYASDSWSFSGGTNYNDQGPVTITDSIAKADAVCIFPNYSVVYDGSA